MDKITIRWKTPGFEDFGLKAGETVDLDINAEDVCEYGELVSEICRALALKFPDMEFNPSDFVVLGEEDFWKRVCGVPVDEDVVCERKIKHWQGYGSVDAKVLKNDKDTLVIRVSGMHEYGLDCGKYHVYDWLVKRFAPDRAKSDIESIDIDDRYTDDSPVKEICDYTIRFRPKYFESSKKRTPATVSERPVKNAGRTFTLWLEDKNGQVESRSVCLESAKQGIKAVDGECWLVENGGGCFKVVKVWSDALDDMMPVSDFAKIASRK